MYKMKGTRKTWKRLLSFACVLSVLLALAACGNSNTPAQSGTPTPAQSPAQSAAPQDPGTMTADEKAANASVTMKLGTKMTADGIEGQAFQKFADLVYEYSNGDIYVEVYPSEQLGNQTTQISNTIMGSQELFIESGDVFSVFTKEFELTSIPFLFPSYDDYWNFVSGDFGRQQEATLEANGLILLNTNRDWVRGPDRVLGCSKKAIQTVDDLKGLTFRCWDSAKYMDGYATLGANPLVVAWSESYLAMKQGTIDSVTTTMINYYDAGFGEVGKYISVINEFPQELFLVINKDLYNSLTADQQKWLHDAANDAATYSNESLNAAWDDAVAKLEEMGCTIYEFDTAGANAALRDYFIKMEDAGDLPEGLCAQLGYR